MHLQKIVIHLKKNTGTSAGNVASASLQRDIGATTCLAGIHGDGREDDFTSAFSPSPMSNMMSGASSASSVGVRSQSPLQAMF